MSLSNIFQTLKAQMFSECKISRALYSFTDDTTYVLAPPPPHAEATVL